MDNKVVNEVAHQAPHREASNMELRHIQQMSTGSSQGGCHPTNNKNKLRMNKSP